MQIPGGIKENTESVRIRNLEKQLEEKCPKHGCSLAMCPAPDPYENDLAGALMNLHKLKEELLGRKNDEQDRFV